MFMYTLGMKNLSSVSCTLGSSNVLRNADVPTQNGLHDFSQALVGNGVELNARFGAETYANLCEACQPCEPHSSIPCRD